MPAELLRVEPAGRMLGRKKGALAAGLALVAMGPAALGLSIFAGSASEVVIPSVLGVAGLLQLHQSLASGRPRERRAVSAALWLAAAACLVVAGGERSVELVAAMLIGADGALRVAEGARLRRREASWAWLALAGGPVLLLAAAMAAELPPAAYVIAGAPLGVALVADGVSLILAKGVVR